MYRRATVDDELNLPGGWASALNLGALASLRKRKQIRLLYIVIECIVSYEN